MCNPAQTTAEHISLRLVVTVLVEKPKGPSDQQLSRQPIKTESGAYHRLGGYSDVVSCFSPEPHEKGREKLSLISTKRWFGY